MYGAAFNPHVSYRELITYGVNHIKWWHESQGEVRLDVGKFGKVAPHVVHSVAFLPGGSKVATGMPTGGIAIWSQHKLSRVVPAHGKGQPIVRPDGSKAHNGVRCLRLADDGETLYSAGGDGCIIRWDCSSGDIEPQSKVTAATLPALYEDAPPLIRGLDLNSKSSDRKGGVRMIVGTRQCDLWEVQEDGSPVVVVYGHAAHVYALAWHPVRHSLFATASDAHRIFLFDSDKRRLSGRCNLREKLRCLAFSPDGENIAAGSASGGVHIVETKSMRPKVYAKPFVSAVEDIKYSPDGKLLAAGSHDMCAKILDATSQRLEEVCKCEGPSSTVKHVDFSKTGAVLMTNSAAYELLYFDTNKGRQVRRNQRDTEFASWTCTLGFPVMGIWPPASNGTDVNSVDRLPSKEHIAIADDFGLVRLANYPCVVDNAPCAVGRGHSSHVANVRASPDNRRLASVGSRDRSIFVWRVKQITEPRHEVRPPWADWEPEDGAEPGR